MGNFLIQITGFHQFPVGSHTGNSAFFQNDDPVGIFDGSNSLRNNNNGGVRCPEAQFSSQDLIGFIIKGRKTVVKNQDFRVSCDGSSNGKTLF